MKFALASNLESTGFFASPLDHQYPEQVKASLREARKALIISSGEGIAGSHWSRSFRQANKYSLALLAGHPNSCGSNFTAQWAHFRPNLEVIFFFSYSVTFSQVMTSTTSCCVIFLKYRLCVFITGALDFSLLPIIE